VAVVLVALAVVAWNGWPDHRARRMAAETQVAPTPAGGGPPSAPPATTVPGNPPVPAGAQPVLVALALDGDSLRVRGEAPGTVIPATGTVKIGLIGIDAPELHGDDGRPQCYAQDARENLRALAPTGRTLLVTADREPRDPDGRFLVYAWTPTGIFLNLDQARLGYAKAREIWPNVARSGEIAAAVFDAHRAGRGLWGACG
jgi:micrococcal nuclease